jgi:hypothetical protein
VELQKVSRDSRPSGEYPVIRIDVKDGRKQTIPSLLHEITPGHPMIATRYSAQFWSVFFSRPKPGPAHENKFTNDPSFKQARHRQKIILGASRQKFLSFFPIKLRKSLLARVNLCCGKTVHRV